MLVDLLVPFRFGDDPRRDRAFGFVRRWYLERHPNFKITVGTCHPSEPWSKGLAVRRALARSRRPVLVVADADVLARPDLLNECVERVEDGAAHWAQPHAQVFRLSRVATENLYAAPVLPNVRVLAPRLLERRAHVAPAGGGIVVATRAAWEAVGGIDPRFVGWGGEDISLARALETLVGPSRRVGGVLWHLYHEPAPRRAQSRASEESERLASRYLDAVGDIAAMRSLVDEHRELIDA